jgi:hypothetical protein
MYDLQYPWYKSVDSKRVYHLQQHVEQYGSSQDALCNRVVMMRCESIVTIRVIGDGNEGSTMIQVSGLATRHYICRIASVVQLWTMVLELTPTSCRARGASSAGTPVLLAPLRSMTFLTSIHKSLPRLCRPIHNYLLTTLIQRILIASLRQVAFSRSELE